MTDLTYWLCMANFRNNPAIFISRESMIDSACQQLHCECLNSLQSPRHRKYIQIPKNNGIVKV